MAISEDLRSVQAILGAMLGSAPTAGTGFSDGRNARETGLVSLLCDNLSALADQVEALEAVPLAPVSSLRGGTIKNGFLAGLPCQHGGGLPAGSGVGASVCPSVCSADAPLQ